MRSSGWAAGTGLSLSFELRKDSTSQRSTFMVTKVRPGLSQPRLKELVYSASNNVFARLDWRMMLWRVPRLRELWSGTGTVTVVPSFCNCIIRWLPRWRTATNPCRSSILQTSVPQRTFSLPNGNLSPAWPGAIAAATRCVILKQRRSRNGVSAPRPDWRASLRSLSLGSRYQAQGISRRSRRLRAQ